MQFTDIPLDQQSFVPVIEAFEHNKVDDSNQVKCTIPLTMKGKIGEAIRVEYLNATDKEKNEIGHVGEQFYGVLCDESAFFPLEYGTVLPFIKQDEGQEPLLNMEWLADQLLKETPDKFDLREALSHGESDD